MLSGFRFSATIPVDLLVKKIWDTIKQLQQVLVFVSPLALLYVSIMVARLIRDLFWLYEYRLRMSVSVPLRMSRWRRDWTPPVEAHVLLPAEIKYRVRFETISKFRRALESFSIEQALEEYRREPIAYALALAELNAEVYFATWFRYPDAVRAFTSESSRMRRVRDIVGDGGKVYSSLTFLQVLRFSGTEILTKVNPRMARTLQMTLAERQREFELKLRHRQDRSQIAWETQFWNFARNIVSVCQYAGSEVDDLAPPADAINNLRKFASDRRQELAPLLEVNGRLNKELTSYKRINAALQTRHTIEKLVFELPDTAQYDHEGSGPKWLILWDQIWADARENENNPFHDLWTQATGQYARDNIRDKGRALFADMSGEIHGYEQRPPRYAFDYEHFDISARKIAMRLHENLIVDNKTGDVKWDREIRKYPVAWPDEDNLELTTLERLNGKLTSLQRRLDTATAERDRVQAGIDAGADTNHQRQRDVEANATAQEAEGVYEGLGDMFGDGG